MGRTSCCNHRGASLHSLELLLAMTDDQVAWWCSLFLITLMPIGVVGNLEGDALSAFRQSLIDGSNVLQSWDPTLVNPCTWFHVTCNAENSVTRVDLGNAGLSGTLVPQLGVLTNLQYLELYSNQIVGPIPKELGNISNLVSLDLYQNNFTGTIPDSLGQLSNLRFLRLNNNSLTGSIPVSLTAIQELQVLDLSYNKLSGEVPTNGCFSLLTTISFLGNNGLCGSMVGKQCPGQPPPPPSDSKEVAALHAFRLNVNDSTNVLKGWDPTLANPCNWLHVTCNNESNVVRLDLGNAGLSGTLASELGVLTNLQYLELFGNSISGPLPKELGNMTALISLDLYQNNFTGNIPNSLGQLNNLQFLRLYHNKLTGYIPLSLTTINGLQILDLSNNKLIGSVPSLNYLNTLTILDLSNNRFTGIVPSLNYLNNLITLNLSNNKFIGSPPIFGDLFNLTTLDLSNNKFTGSLPLLGELHSFPTINLSVNLFTGLSQGSHGISKLYLDNNNITDKLNISAFVGSGIGKNQTLTLLSLKDNRITEVLSRDSDPLKAGHTVINLQGNPYCNNTWHSEADALSCSVYCLKMCFYTSKSKNWKVNKIVVMASTISSVVILMFVILGFTFILRRNRKYIRDLQKKIKLADVNAKRFEYNELRVATRNFAPEMKLGAGANGAVYKGILPNNLVVAVKQLFQETNGSKPDDFLNEILLISNLQHRNLANLKGYCVHGKQTLLVYEYVDNYDLDKLLLSRHKMPAHNTSNVQVLDWQARINVCQGVAQGLYYLHASSDSRIIHRDIKASNILLDRNLHPKIADFGLARPIQDAQSVILTQQCAGTLGYLAPEYESQGQLSEKADVYSFGVLLLEIVSGKRNRDLTMPEDEVYLPTRVWKLHRENRLMDIIDTTLALTDDEAMEVQRVLETAVLCVQSDPKKRPSMFLVAAMLAGKANVDVVSIGEDERGILDGPARENPLFNSVTDSSRGSALSNGNATIELST